MTVLSLTWESPYLGKKVLYWDGSQELCLSCIDPSTCLLSAHCMFKLLLPCCIQYHFSLDCTTARGNFIEKVRLQTWWHQVWSLTFPMKWTLQVGGYIHHETLHVWLTFGHALLIWWPLIRQTVSIRFWTISVETFIIVMLHRMSGLEKAAIGPAVHYSDVIMGTLPSQITSLTIFYSIVYSDADQRKHQSSASLAFVRGIHRGLVNSPHRWPVRRKMFPFDEVIMFCTFPGNTGLILGLRPANERRRYKVTPSLIGWVQTLILGLCPTNERCCYKVTPSLIGWVQT